MVAALAPVPADVRLRLRQTAEPGSDLARLDRSSISLRNATLADLDRLVRFAASRSSSAGVHGVDVFHRISDPIPRVWSAPVSAGGVSVDCRAASADLSDRQLLFL